MKTTSRPKRDFQRLPLSMSARAIVWLQSDLLIELAIEELTG